MNLFIFLDTGPLGIITNPKRPPETVEMLLWAATQIRAGHRFFVPAIADYEVRRELVRLRRAAGIKTLNAWNQATPDRYGCRAKTGRDAMGRCSQRRSCDG